MKNLLRPTSPFILLALAIASSAAHAAKPPLIDRIVATYSVVGSGSCQDSQTPYAAYPALTNSSGSWLILDTWESQLNMHASGAVTESVRGQYAIPNVVQQPVGDYSATCLYSSTANPDGSLTLIGSCNGQTLSGIGLGETTTHTPVIWRLVESGNLILMSRIGTDPSTLTSNPNGVFYRLCQGRAVGTK